MTEIIHIHKRGKHHDKLFLLGSFLFGAVSVMRIIAKEFDTYAAIFAINSIVYLIYGLKGMSIPRMEINDETIFYKGDIFKTVKIIDWNSIREISFGSYKIDFKLEGKQEYRIKINTTFPEISVSVKEAISKMAEKKNIRVNPG